MNPIEYNVRVYENGKIYWFNQNGELHRKDAPTEMKLVKYKVKTYPNGIIKYLNEDEKLHRENGPAIVYPNGYKRYYLDGKLHRNDGPAVVYPNRNVEYWIDGRRFEKRNENMNSISILSLVGLKYYFLERKNSKCWYWSKSLSWSKHRFWSWVYKDIEKVPF